MSLSSPTPPAVTDPNITAADQQQLNTEAQQSSNINQVTPYGSLSFNQTGTGANGTPIYTATTQLSPQQQSLLNTLQGTQQTAGTQASNLLTNANYGSSDPAATIGGATSGTTQALLGQETSYLQPYFTQQTTQLDTQLRNQGLAPGQPAYDNAMRALQNNQGNTVTGYLATAEPAAYSQATQSYELPLSLASTEMGISQPGSVTSNLAPTTAEQPANLVAATSSAQQAQEQTYQAQQTAYNAMISGLFGVGKTALGGWAMGA